MELPTPLPSEESVLEIGCGAGQTLVAPELRNVRRRCGDGTDKDAVECGRRRFPELELCCSCAEQHSFGSGEFDLVISRVALPYTNIPAALREAHRVLRPGSRIWGGWIPPIVKLQRLRRSIRSRNLKPFLNARYVRVNSIMLNSLGVTISRPRSPLRECMQTVTGVMRCLAKAGFKDIAVDHKGQVLLMEGRAL